MTRTMDIHMSKEDTRDQAGMEHAFRKYFEDLKRDGGQQLNELLEAEFAFCSFEEKEVWLKTNPKPWMANPEGLMHGGIIASYLDYAMGMLCHYSVGERLMPTLHLDVNYLRPVMIGKPSWIRAKIIKQGRNVTYAEGAIYPEGMKERLLAVGTGSYYKTE